MSTPRQKIRELCAWREEGLLSEAEFCQRKNAILDSEFAPGAARSSAGDPAQQTDLGLLAGQEIGGAGKPYRLERLLGQGGMGQVWQATDLATQAELGHSDLVALKILPPQLTQSTPHARLLIEEAALVRKLAHENIVRVYEWARDPATGSYFIIMEYLDGQDLASYLAMHGPRSLDQALSLLAPVAQALQYAWDKHRLVHRDLKPGNLFLTRQGEVKLLDFGIAARLRSAPHPGNGGDPSTLAATLTGAAAWAQAPLPDAGTAGYRAPEAGTQLHPSPSLDVYAVAVMLYQMLQGALPFGAQRHPAQRPHRPAMLSGAQWQVLQDGFALAPGQRPPSVRALLDALQGKPGRHSASAAPNPAHQARNSETERQIVQAEAAARLRAEQRRQHKELAEQRRRQASAALRALIEKQRQAHSAPEPAAASPPVVPAAPQPPESNAPAHMNWENVKRYLAWIGQETGRPFSPAEQALWENGNLDRRPKGKC